jgi:NADH:ubiquinone reductase (H+-translocating)
MHVVVIGGGYAGLRVVQTLAPHNLQVTLIEPRSEHILRPRLVAAAAGRLPLKDVSLPYTRVLDSKVRHLKANALRIDLEGLEVETDSETVKADRLVLAVGSEGRLTVPGAARYSLPLYTLEDLQQILNHWSSLEEALKREQCDLKLLRWVIVGGGLVGVELAAELVHLARRWRKRYGGLADAIQIHLVQRSDRLLPEWPASVSDWVLRWLRRHRVIVQLDTQVKRVRADMAILEGPDGSEELATQTLLWAGGTQPVRIEEEPEGVRDGQQFLRVGSDCRMIDHPYAYALGDSILLGDGKKTYPPCGQLAVRAAEIVAANILAEQQGQSTTAFIPSVDRIALSLGAFDGVALVDGQELYGTAGWAIAQAADLLYYNAVLNPLIGRITPEIYKKPTAFFENFS